MLIFVSKPTGGANLRLEVEPEDLVEAIKIRIKDSEGYELEEITLVSGVIVLENDRSLNEYRLQNESTLTLKVGSRTLFNKQMEKFPIEDAVEHSAKINAGVITDECKKESTTSSDVQPESSNCAMCPEDDVLAQFICLNCGRLPLCMTCKDRHLRRMQKHVAVSLDTPSMTICSKHPHNFADLCCSDPCHEIICATCGLLEHASHKFSSLPEAAERERAQLQEVANAVASATATSVLTVAERMKDLKNLIADLDTLVDQEGEKLIESVTEKMAEAHAAIKMKSAPQLHRLEQDKKVAEELDARFRSNAAVAHRLLDPEKCSDAEVYRLAPVVRNIFEAIANRVPSTVAAVFIGDTRLTDKHKPLLQVHLEVAEFMAEQARALFVVEGVEVEGDEQLEGSGVTFRANSSCALRRQHVYDPDSPMFGSTGLIAALSANGNAHDRGLIVCNRSSSAAGSARDFVEVGPVGNSQTNDATYSWMSVDLGVNNRMRVTDYCLRSHRDQTGHQLRNWDFQGSLDGVTWVVLKSHRNDETMVDVGDAQAHWAVEGAARQHPPHGYRCFRIIIVGPNSSNQHIICVAAMELYGEYASWETPPPPPTNALLIRRQHEYIAFSPLFSSTGLIAALSADGNAHDRGLVVCSRSSSAAGSARDFVEVGPVGNTYTNNSIYSWMSVDLGANNRLGVTDYCLRNCRDQTGNQLRNWDFQGSLDAMTWVVLKRHRSDATLVDASDAQAQWVVDQARLQPSHGYRFFRIIIVGPNSSNQFHVSCAAIELYGEYTSWETPPPPPPRSPLLMRRQHIYVPDTLLFGSMGLIAAFSVDGNAHDRGLVVCSRSSSEVGSARDFVESGPVGRSHTNNAIYSWMSLDLGANNRMRVTDYCLRSLRDQTGNQLRNWDFQGSLDGVTWVVLKSHRNDETMLDLMDSQAHWLVDAAAPQHPSHGYRFFRIIIVGPNSSNTHYMCVAALELYGDYTSWETPLPPPAADPLLIHHQHVFEDDAPMFGSTGLIAALSADGNAHERGLVVCSRSSSAAGSARDLVEIGPVGNTYTNNSIYSWMSVDLGANNRMRVTGYCLRSRLDHAGQQLRNWDFQGSVDGLTWVLLKRHRNDLAMADVVDSQAHWVVEGAAPQHPPHGYRFFRVIIVGPNSSNSYHLSIASMELFGEFTLWEMPPPTPRAPLLNRRQHVHVLDTPMFGSTGLIAALSADGNAHDRGLVVCSRSSSAAGSARDFVEIGPVGNSQTNNAISSWMSVDLGVNNRMRVTDYCLRSLRDQAGNQLRNWDFQGSLDGVTWVVLKSHRNDETMLDLMDSQTHWAIEDAAHRQPTHGYRCFRIVIVGPNSTNGHSISVAAIELYGEYISSLWSV